MNKKEPPPAFRQLLNFVCVCLFERHRKAKMWEKSWNERLNEIVRMHLNLYNMLFIVCVWGLSDFDIYTHCHSTHISIQELTFLYIQRPIETTFQRNHSFYTATVHIQMIALHRENKNVTKWLALNDELPFIPVVPFSLSSNTVSIFSIICNFIFSEYLRTKWTMFNHMKWNSSLLLYVYV